jgi:GNAT superfamily N-acetyltransferase
VKRTQKWGPRGADGPAAAAGIAGAAPPGVAATPAWPEGRIRVRQASHADQGALGDFLTRLSAQTRYLRFFTGAALTSPAMLRVLAGDGPGADAVVATRGGVIIGHAMAAYETGAGATLVADIGVVVADEWQGQGVGSWLTRTLVARARARGATTLVMDVLAENRKMLAMIAGWWPGACHDRSAAQVTVRVPLRGVAQRRLTAIPVA